MANTISIGILGLGRMGASLGLAIKASNGKDARQQFTLTGYDTDSERAREAKSLGAVDQIANRAADAAAGRDIVLMCLPYGEVEGGYGAISTSLRQGAVVLDTTAHSLRAAGWAKALLPQGTHRVGIHPVVNPAYLFDGVEWTGFARADLFKGGSLLVLADAYAAPEAVELAGNFASLIGTTAHYVDPTEHDGWMALLEALPAALALSAFTAIAESEGWGDAQRAADPNFGRLTHVLADTQADDLRGLLLGDRENLVRVLDATLRNLSTLRDQIATNDTGAVSEAAERATEAYATWLGRRQSGNWDERRSAMSTGSSATMTVLLGGALAKRLRTGSSKDPD